MTLPVLPKMARLSWGPRVTCDTDSVHESLADLLGMKNVGLCLKTAMGWICKCEQRQNSGKLDGSGGAPRKGTSGPRPAWW